MADDSLKPIVYRAFKNESDKEYVDVEDIKQEFLAETKNLTSSRKLQSLSIIGGTSFAELNGIPLSQANLPSVPSDYILVDFTTFSIDRDNKEIMLLVFENSITKEIKLFVNPFYQPNQIYSNYAPYLREQESWVNSWLEITEYYTGTITGSSISGNSFQSATNFSAVDGYFNGWFVANTTKIGTITAGLIAGEDFTHFNFVTNYVASTNTFVCKNSLATWDDDPMTVVDSIFLCRFPVIFTYNANTETFAGCGTTFKGRPTGFYSQQNQLRMPCGKDQRPLCLTMVYKRKYFFGTDSTGSISSEIKYDGFWFDFQQIPQVQKKSAIGAFSKAQTVLTATTWKVNKHGIFDDAATGDAFSLISDTDITSRTIRVSRTGALGSALYNVANYEEGVYRYFYINKETKELVFAPYNHIGVSSYTMTNVGSGYDPNSAIGYIVTFSSPETGGNTVLASKAVINLAGQVTGFSILSTGSGYITAPTITIQAPGGGGTQATATCSLNGSPVTPPTIADIVSKINASPTLADTLTSLVVGISGSMDIVHPYGDYTERVFSGDGFLGADAGGNQFSYNRFVGAYVSANQACVSTITSMDNVIRNAFILSLLYDSRNELMVSHGIIRPSSTGTITTAGTATYAFGLELQFNSWFSRRLTNINYYSKNLNNDLRSGSTSDPNITTMSKELESYPYYAYTKQYLEDTSTTAVPVEADFDIHRVALFETYSIYEFAKDLNGNLVKHVSIVDVKSGKNAFTYDYTNGYWYTKFRDDYNGIKASGFGLTYISNTGRYLTKDSTMNYTRCTYLGEINGRYFLIGCKNNVEQELFESDDNIIYNKLGAGVSQYDVFAKDDILFVNVGDKDILRDILILDNYLMCIKDTNVFAVDVNTEDRLRFRIVDTQIGRGCNDPDAICYTPHGLVMPSSDSVYLVSNQGSQPLLTNENGRLNFYKTYFANQRIFSIYNPAYDEVYLCQYSTNSSNLNYIMVYSFKFQNWTTIEYNTVTNYAGMSIKKVCSNSAKQLLFLNSKDYNHFNITKLDDTVGTNYINVNGTTENLAFSFKSHYIPYGDKLKDILMEAFTMNFDYYSGLSYLTLTVNRKGLTSETILLTLPSVNSTAYNKVYNIFNKMLAATDQIQIQLQNVSGVNIQPFTQLNINSIILWITLQNRQLVQGLS